MKVLHLVTHAAKGGAARAAGRIVAAQQQVGVEAQILAALPNTAAPKAAGWFRPPALAAKYKLMQAREVLPTWLHMPSWKQSFQFTQGIAGLPLHQHPLVQAADIIHLHWFAQGFLSLGGVRQLAALGKPMFWTVHDMWAVTGGCHYNGQCEHYLQACGNCPLLSKPSSHDLSAVVFGRKQALYANVLLHFVAPSSWLQKEVSTSPLTKRFPCRIVPYPIDAQHTFTQAEMAQVRERWRLPQEVPLLLFPAFNLSDPRKGAHLIPEVLAELHAKGVPAQLVTVGQAEVAVPGVKVFNMGYRSNPREMASLYAACNATLVPSLQDNLPNVVLESLACGTPVAAFSIGGIPDMVIDGQTGYLAEALTAPDLAAAVSRTLDEQAELRSRARAFALENFAELVVGNAYRKLYEAAFA